MEYGPFLLWFEDFLPEHVSITGKKALSIAQMRKAGMRIPPGFAVTIRALDFLMSETGLGDLIRASLSRFERENLKDLRVADEAGSHIRELFKSTPLPEPLRNLLWDSYSRLSETVGIACVPVAVRSSGMVSRPGLFSSFLNISGRVPLEKKLLACWASAYSSRALAMRAREGLPLEHEPIGVVVCQFIPARSAGVLFTAHPITGNPNRCVIEASWGLGESVVQASVAPDRFTVNRTTLEIEERDIRTKLNQVIPGIDGVEVKWVLKSHQDIPSLTDEEIISLVSLAGKVEDYFDGVPQDIEWAVSMDYSFPDSIFLLQARPIVGIKEKTRNIAKPKGMSDPDHIAELMVERLFG